MDIKWITITNSFQNILDESNGRPKKIWQIKADNFIIDQRNYGCRIILEKCIQHLRKESMLLLKDLLEP